MLDRIRQLQPIQFRYRPQIDPRQQLRAGFSAQQVQQIFPEAVVSVGGVLHLDVARLEQYVRQAQREWKQQNA